MTWSLFRYILRYRKSFIYSGACIIVSLVLLYLSRNIEDFAQWYATMLFPLIPNTLGRLSSSFPFSIFEIGIYTIFLFLLFILLKSLWLVMQNKPELKVYLSTIFRRGICFLSSLVLVFTLTGSINYSRTSFANTSGLAVQETTQEELINLSMLLIEDINEIIPNVGIDYDGFLVLDETDIHKEAIDAMSNLGNKYSALSGYYPKPKPILLSKAMSYLGITGIYSPFTLEANYNKDVASFVIPYTICHELAHLKGFMREEEAGFIAYLACRESNSYVLQYSGALNALKFTLNALYANVSLDEFKTVYNHVPLQVKKEFDYSRFYWQQHSGSITSIAKAANNKYLIANAQVAGTKSYGIMVDLLMAEYADVIRDSILL